MTEYKKLDVAVEGTRFATIVMPAGTYYLGDPCYSVPDDQWIPWLEAADYTNVTTYALAASIDGHPVLGFGTAWGDGEYRDQHGNAYGVDAGLIGLVPEALGTRYDLGLVQRVTFDTPVVCTMDGGVLSFGSYVIDTDPQDEDDDDEW